VESTLIRFHNLKPLQFRFDTTANLGSYCKKMKAEVLSPEQMSVVELKQWLSKFGEQHREHFRSNKVPGPSLIRGTRTRVGLSESSVSISSSQSTSSSLVESPQRAEPCAEHDSCVSPVMAPELELDRLDEYVDMCTDDHQPPSPLSPSGEYCVVSVNKAVSMPVSEHEDKCAFSWDTTEEFPAPSWDPSWKPSINPCDKKKHDSPKVSKNECFCTRQVLPDTATESKEGHTIDNVKWMGATTTKSKGAKATKTAVAGKAVSKKKEPSTIELRRQELEKKWAADRRPVFSRQIHWQPGKSSGSYKKKVVLHYEEPV
jgi:hypothetical protein